MLKLYRIGLLMIMIMILHHTKLHVPEMCGKICRMQHKCRTYALHILPNSAYFPTYFVSKCSAYFKKILCYKLASLVRDRFYNNCSFAQTSTAYQLPPTTTATATISRGCVQGSYRHAQW